MASLLVVLLYAGFMLTPSEAVYVWTEWSSDARCVRSCSKPFGLRSLHRTCMRCDDGRCEPVDGLYCGGGIGKKIQLCYVGTQCTGPGPYRGEWTEWSSFGVCPAPGERCRGRRLVSLRRCVLPAAYGGALLLFRCPGYQAVRRLTTCPCGRSTWSEWSSWSACRPAAGGDERVRRRVCVAVVDGRRRIGRCCGAHRQQAPCPAAAAAAAAAAGRATPPPYSGGPPRARRPRSVNETTEGGGGQPARSIKQEVLQIDWNKAALANLPQWAIPAGIAGMVAAVFVVSCCLAIFKIYMKNKQAKSAKAATDADGKPLLEGDATLASASEASELDESATGSPASSSMTSQAATSDDEAATAEQGSPPAGQKQPAAAAAAAKGSGQATTDAKTARPKQ